ncbi:MAG: polyprenyl synthetase family protein [Candidatus Eremiobacterota bacterium]
MSDIKEYLYKKKILVEDYLRKILIDRNLSGGILAQAIEYSLFTGGKRFRPVLCLASSEAVGGNDEIVLPAACAIELIHNYSLIHDDLPCMDNDDYRRGKLTCHRKFDEPAALLAGDGLLTLAFDVLSGNYISASAGNVLRTINEIACAAGISGMVGGQVIDLSCNQETVEELEKLHKMKTGALIRVSVRAGALLNMASEECLSLLTVYAENLGLAFQIMDDVLDFDKDKLKNSFLSVYNQEEAKRKIHELTEEAVKSLEVLGERAERLRQIAWYLSDRKF